MFKRPTAWHAAPALAALTVSIATACLNDRDLRYYAGPGRAIVSPVRAVSGLFPRQPDAYYRDRLQRVSKGLDAEPKHWSWYDDAAVACDRLGEHDKAIAYAQRKWKLLAREKRDDPEVRKHIYRYYANLGTFHAHRWLNAGAKRDDLKDLKLAKQFIDKALNIDPDAHFGRERYQLLLIEWALDPPRWKAQPKAKRHPYSLASRVPTFLKLPPEKVDLTRPDTGASLKELGHADAIEALSGLIMLGNAWESVDVFHALSIALHIDGQYALAYYARMRAVELIGAGHHSLHPDAPQGEALLAHIGTTLRPSDQTAHLAGAHERIRTQVAAWHQRRTEYMLSTIKQGRHPDTDPAFWIGFWIHAEQANSEVSEALGMAAEALAETDPKPQDPKARQAKLLERAEALVREKVQGQPDAALNHLRATDPALSLDPLQLVRDAERAARQALGSRPPAPKLPKPDKTNKQ